jgi:hypothetical protein
MSGATQVTNRVQEAQYAFAKASANAAARALSCLNESKGIERSRYRGGNGEVA